PLFFGLTQYALVVFFLSAVFIFRRFILYPRTKRKIRAWNLFLVSMGVSLAITLKGSIGSTAFALIYGSYLILILYLSVNVRWISYLNFNQKLRALGLFALIVVVIVTYLIATQRLPVQLDMEQEANMQYEFLLHLMLFTIVYSLFSILALFFNLPTTSVFEQEGFEITSFDKINQAIQSNLDYTEIMNTLLDVSIMRANANAGWIEMRNEESGEMEVKLSKKITLNQIQSLKQDYNLTEKVLRDQNHYLVRNTKRHRAFRDSDSRYKCLLAVPIVSSNQSYGAIYVANELINSFEDVSIKFLTTYAEQAGIAFENARLIKNSIEVERYQEQLKIAQEVQQQLLPRNLPYSDKIEFVAMSETAFEVGGDYYDVVNPSEDIYRVAVGDVSGKGTTAAFYMAEIKGIFHALTRLELSVKEFVTTANLALSACMQKGFFMTLTYLEINLKARKFEMIRAGHCPAFMYCAETDQVKMLRDGTLGLGIVRNETYGKYIHGTETIHYHSGDILILYTDGIMEARNAEGEEFGYDRFQKLIEDNKRSGAAELASLIVESVKSFTHTDIQDDYTLLVIRFI
ncbi:MAG: SpoIIE family protein phosphatase, partial [Bacteroidota bacterium]